MCPGQRPAPALDEGTVHVIATGETARIRHGRPEDLDRVNAMHLRCTVTSRYHRYQAPRQSLGHAEWANLTDPALGTTWLLALDDAPDEVITITVLTHMGNTPMLAIARRFGVVPPRAAYGTVDLTIRVPGTEGRRP